MRPDRRDVKKAKFLRSRSQQLVPIDRKERI